ncbi:MAG: AAA family ATPase [Treponemataceae bacterium]
MRIKRLELNSYKRFKKLTIDLGDDPKRIVALVGANGCGKSSIIASYKKARPKKAFLNISLACFAMEKDCNSQSNTQEEINRQNNIRQTEQHKKLEQELHKIEKSILQQFFYRQAGKRFPFSRFKRINNLSQRKTLGIASCIFALGASAFFLFAQTHVQNLRQLLTQHLVWTSISLVILVLVLGYFLVYVIRFINKIQLSKLSIQSIDLGIDDVNNESLLNRYLDEILYFFEATKYEVVIFEDIDRFENTEIFVKLRELNNTLNNYEPIKRRIIFIYALRDEVFTDCERTKFFEFIIPVIPVITSQNSADILITQRKENPNTPLKYLDEGFLQDIGLYIDDMRLLKNCINEFIIYDKKINQDYYDKKKGCKEPHNRNKIFALILYKNLHPKDFAELGCNRGELYAIFANKKELIKNKQDRLEKEIQDKQEEITMLGSLLEMSIKELRLIYIAAIFAKKSQDTYIKESPYYYTSDEKFEALRTGTNFTVYNNYNNYYGRQIVSSSFTYSFAQIETEVHPTLSYAERESLINQKISGKIDQLERGIEVAHDQIINLSNQSLSALLNEVGLDKILPSTNTINKDFISYLLRNGRITEDYFDYMSYFYEGVLSRTDKDFLRLVKSYGEPSFEIALNKHKNVINRLSNNDWHNYAILNNSLLDYLLENKSDNLNSFIRTMLKYEASNKAKSFFNQYRNTDIEYFYQSVYDIAMVNATWASDLFNPIDFDVFYNFFINVKVDHNQAEYEDMINNNKAFLYRAVIDKYIVPQKLQELSITLELDEDMKGFPILQVLIDNNLYTISTNSFNIVIGFYKPDVQAPIVDYYTQLLSIPNKSMHTYINEDIRLFVRNVLLPLGSKIQENEESFITLLNNTYIEDSDKEELITNSQAKIRDIKAIKKDNKAEEEPAETTNDDEQTENNESHFSLWTENEESSFSLWTCIVKNNKMEATANNILAYFEYSNNIIDEALSEFLNNGENINTLSKEELEANDLVDSFYSRLVELPELSLVNLSALVNAYPYFYEKLSDCSITKEKMEYLISNKKLV